MSKALTDNVTRQRRAKTSWRATSTTSCSVPGLVPERSGQAWAYYNGTVAKPEHIASTWKTRNPGIITQPLKELKI